MTRFTPANSAYTGVDSTPDGAWAVYLGFLGTKEADAGGEIAVLVDYVGSERTVYNGLGYQKALLPPPVAMGMARQGADIAVSWTGNGVRRPRACPAHGTTRPGRRAAPLSPRRMPMPSTIACASPEPDRHETRRRLCLSHGAGRGVGLQRHPRSTRWHGRVASHGDRRTAGIHRRNARPGARVSVPTMPPIRHSSGTGTGRPSIGRQKDDHF